MSKITGDEAKHWHDKNGKHRMPDPRRAYERGSFLGEAFEGQLVKDVPRSLWDPDERAYAEHLEEHGKGVKYPLPEPHPDDSEVVQGLFAMIESNERQNEIMRQLIMNLRERGRQMEEGDQEPQPTGQDGRLADKDAEIN